MCAEGQVQGWKSLETKSKEDASTHTHGQNRSNFIHGVAVSSRTDVGILIPWTSKSQLHGHIVDEGVHPRGASTNTHKLQPESRDAIMNTVYSRGLQSQVVSQQHHCDREGDRNVKSLALNRPTVWGRAQHPTQ
jgi:hypothetical protein